MNKLKAEAWDELVKLCDDSPSPFYGLEKEFFYQKILGFIITKNESIEKSLDLSDKNPNITKSPGENIMSLKTFVETIVIDSIDYLELNPKMKNETIEHIWSQLPFFDSKKDNFYTYCCYLSISFLKKTEYNKKEK